MSKVKRNLSDGDTLLIYSLTSKISPNRANRSFLWGSDDLGESKYFLVWQRIFPRRKNKHISIDTRFPELRLNQAQNEKHLFAMDTQLTQLPFRGRDVYLSWPCESQRANFNSIYPENTISGLDSLSASSARYVINTRWINISQLFTVRYASSRIFYVSTRLCSSTQDLDDTSVYIRTTRNAVKLRRLRHTRNECNVRFPCRTH